MRLALLFSLSPRAGSPTDALYRTLLQIGEILRSEDAKQRPSYSESTFQSASASSGSPPRLVESSS